jgi:hypothetical protein
MGKTVCRTLHIIQDAAQQSYATLLTNRLDNFFQSCRVHANKAQISALHVNFAPNE